MFGLVILFCIPLFLMMAASYRSACRHAKRAEMYRKQIEELQIERAKVIICDHEDENVLFVKRVSDNGFVSYECGDGGETVRDKYRRDIKTTKQ